MNKSALEEKQREFNKAMAFYHAKPYYQYIYKVVSFIILSVQILLFLTLFRLDITVISFVSALFIAYFLTDFINGYVHLYMDNNDKYSSKWGAFIASFHLHHETSEYKDAKLFTVYFNESGAKFWLVPYVFIVLGLSTLEIHSLVLMILIFIAILSSVAEVSHYLCHNSQSKFVHLLQNMRILLPMSQHEKHHKHDNTHYAFLNGSSDFLLNIIAKKYYKGYKEHSDKHFEKYEGRGTKNRG
jgi:hypothetical protein